MGVGEMNQIGWFALGILLMAVPMISAGMFGCWCEESDDALSRLGYIASCLAIFPGAMGTLYIFLEVLQ
jgi:hypothetical protein